MIDLGTPGSVSSALGINGRGQVLVYTESGATRRTSLWKDGTVTDLGTLPGRTSAVGQALTDRGQVVGSSFTVGEASSSSAFVRQDGTMIDLGKLPGGDVSVAFDVNQHGDVTGWSSAGRDDNQWQHGVLWTHRPERFVGPLVKSPDSRED
jgi:probable HAF family extracellular repeat protein